MFVCGFLGKISKNNFDFNELEIANQCQICRGPDQTSLLNNFNSSFFDSCNFFGSLIFNRLSIIDLSDRASQPMVNSIKNTLVMFNGEIFNHSELRKEMESEGIQFYTSHSDTEVVLNGLTYFGIDYIKKFIGQFAIFFINTKDRKVYLVRDRLGQKPLFFNISKDALTFSSNLKALVRTNGSSDVDEEMLLKYLQLGVVPSPNTIFKNYFKVEPAEYLEIDLEKFSVKKNKYWKIEDNLDEKEFEFEKLVSLFENSVNIRLESDVPIATFLSGGIDSTSIIKAIEKNNKLNTFSMTFENPKYNEKKWQDIVEKKYKTSHESVLFKNSFTFDNLISVIDILDEPYADISLIPTFYLSKAISKNYKVAISGDGGDELFIGYEHSNISLKNFMFPKINKILYSLYPPQFGTGNKFLSKSNDIKISYPSFFQDNKLLDLLNIKLKSEFIENYFINYPKIEKIIMVADYKFYLSEMMMFKVDRASMANSLEVRSPFVDHRLIEYMLSVNLNNIFNFKNQKKPILRQYLKDDFNQEFFNRSKMGFAFDMETWIYQNLDELKNLLQGSQFLSNIDLVKVLSQKKSRINSHRLWKLLLIEVYLKNVK